jgi:hypothetical protein
VREWCFGFCVFSFIERTTKWYMFVMLRHYNTFTLWQVLYPIGYFTLYGLTECIMNEWMNEWVGINYRIVHGATALSGPHYQSFTITFTCHIRQPITETSTWQKTTLTRERHPWPWRDSNPQSQKAMAIGPQLRLCSHWDRPITVIKFKNIILTLATFVIFHLWGEKLLEHKWFSLYIRPHSIWVALMLLWCQKFVPLVGMHKNLV